MTLFQRYALIYESSMTLAVHEEAPPDTEGLVFSESTMPILPIKLQLSTIDIITEDFDELGGANSDLVIVHFPYTLIYQSVSGPVQEEELVAPDTEGPVFSESPGPVPPVQIQLSSIEAVVDDFAEIGSGWFSDPPPIVLPHLPVYVVDLEQVGEEIAAPDTEGLVFSESPGPTPPIRIQLSSTDAVLEDFAEIGSGWFSDPPPPVPPVQIQIGDIVFVLEEIPDIGSGWWSDAPGPVAPIRVPDSSIAFAEEVAAVAPPSRIRRLRELGMGIIKRQQLG